MFSYGLLTIRERWTYWKESRKGPLRRLRDWSIFHIGKGRKSWNCLALIRLRRDPINLYKYVKRRCKEDGARMFLVGSSGRTGGSV